MPRLVYRFISLKRAAALSIAVLAQSGCARLLGARPVSSDAPIATTFHEVSVSEARRGFLLHRPVRRPTRPMPLIVVLHGSSANANVGMDESGFNAIADSIGALVAYPNGTGGIPYIRLFWNYRDCCGRNGGADEAGLVRALVDTLSNHFPIDRTRIGIVGFSDAGTLAYRLACAESGVVTAIGVIAGEVPDSPCTPRPAVATVVFHGTADRNIRYGRTREHVADWARRENCARGTADSSGRVARTVYAGCDDGAIVALYTIEGGKHGWPGGRPSWRFAPTPPPDVDASRVFAALLMSHPRSVAR